MSKMHKMIERNLKDDPILSTSWCETHTVLSALRTEINTNRKLENKVVIL